MFFSMKCHFESKLSIILRSVTSLIFVKFLQKENVSSQCNKQSIQERLLALKGKYSF